MTSHKMAYYCISAEQLCLLQVIRPPPAGVRGWVRETMFVLGPSQSPSLNPDPWNAAYLSPCLFLSSSSRSTAPHLPRPASQLGYICRSIPPCLS